MRRITGHSLVERWISNCERDVTMKVDCRVIDSLKESRIDETFSWSGTAKVEHVSDILFIGARNDISLSILGVPKSSDIDRVFNPDVITNEIPLEFESYCFDLSVNLECDLVSIFTCNATGFQKNAKVKRDSISYISGRCISAQICSHGIFHSISSGRVQGTSGRGRFTKRCRSGLG
jgi:hypothetical protein